MRSPVSSCAVALQLRFLRWRPSEQVLLVVAGVVRLIARARAQNDPLELQWFSEAASRMSEAASRISPPLGVDADVVAPLVALSAALVCWVAQLLLASPVSFWVGGAAQGTGES